MPLLHEVVHVLGAQEDYPHDPDRPAPRRTAAPAGPTPLDLAHTPPTVPAHGDHKTGGARRLEIVARTAAWMCEHHVSPRIVEAIVNDPQHTRPGYNHATVYAGAA